MKPNMDALMWDIMYIITPMPSLRWGWCSFCTRLWQQKENKHKKSLERDIRKNSWS